MNVVIDTNVFVSSFFGGNPRTIIDLWKNGKIILCLPGKIIDEYVEVLQFVGLQHQSELDEILMLFARQHQARFTAKTPVLKIVASDLDDDKFFECAVALKARVIISGDRDVLAIKDYMGISVCNPRRFLEDFFPSELK